MCMARSWWKQALILVHDCGHVGCCTTTVLEAPNHCFQGQVLSCAARCMMAKCTAFTAHHLASPGRRRAAWLPALVEPLV